VARELPPEAFGSEVALIDPHRESVSARPVAQDRESEPAPLPPEKTAPRRSNPSGALASAKPLPPAAPPTRSEPVASAPVARASVPEVSSAPPVNLPGPDVRVSRTVWHPVADRRLAFVDLQGGGSPVRVREGDTLGPLLVRKIEPSGVIFEQDGVEVRHAINGR
jgi:hypothetical protein